MSDPLDIRSEQAEQDGAVRKGQLRDEQEVEDFKWLMGTKQGRRIMDRLLDRAGVYRSSFDTSALRMAMLEGQRNYGLMWLNEVMAHTPEKFVQMLEERKAA